MHLTYVQSAGKLIDHLKCICPSVVELSIIICEGINNLTLCSLPKLAKVNVKDERIDIRSIVIDSYILRIFKYYGGCSDHGLGCQIDMNKCRNLEVLQMELKPSIEGYSLEVPPGVASGAFPAMSWTPQEIKIKLISRFCYVDTSWFRQLRTFIRKLSSIMIQLSVEFLTPTFTFEPAEKLIGDASFGSPSPHVDILKIRMYSKQENFCTLIDSLLLSCHPKTLSIPCDDQQNFADALCTEILNREAKQNCCRSDHPKCWRHYLKDVEIKHLFGLKYLKTNFDINMQW